MRRRAFLLLLVIANCPGAELKLPLKAKSVRFAVIGDSGTGERPQYEVGRQLADFHADFPFDFVIMLGDNMYGGESPADFKRKFEDPYKPLLDAGVKFYASLGNHDDPNQRFYKPFNMDGKRYYTFKRGEVQFFALDSNYMDPGQLEWLDKELTASNAGWKICFFHHPLYSHGKMHGSDLDLRSQLEPMFERLGVDVVFSGHDHDYERLKPQNGIYYFVLGSSGQLRLHGLRPSGETATGFDTDRTFELVEIAGAELYFQTISRTGETVDSGMLAKRTLPGVPSSTDGSRITRPRRNSAFLPYEGKLDRPAIRPFDKDSQGPVRFEAVPLHGSQTILCSGNSQNIALPLGLALDSLAFADRGVFSAVNAKTVCDSPGGAVVSECPGNVDMVLPVPDGESPGLEYGLTGEVTPAGHQRPCSIQLVVAASGSRQYEYKQDCQDPGDKRAS